ncbi:uncharacterized protein LOC134516529 isoform X3 [Chroicocephalus ridibundus]|uniref:uncharacterized protein LOC134516529 isoform X3 n=1 Tax=Chroicocephalus ridibundus TaxID=1192867 RepID=UPI002FDD3F14
MGSAGAGESSDEGNWFPLGFSPSALPSVILAGRDGRMDGGAPATPGPAWGEEPWEGAGLPEPRLMLPPAWGHVTAWPAPPRRPVRTAPLQLRTASGPAPGRLQFDFGSSSFVAPVCFCSGSSPADGRLQPQLLAAPAHGWLWLNSAPVPCGSSSFAPSVLAPARLRLLFVSALVPVQQMDGSSPSSLRLQLMDGSGSFQPLFLVAAAHLHLRFWLQLVCGSCLFLLWIQSGSWTAPARFQLIWTPAHGWLWLISAPVPCGCSSFAPSGPAPGGLQLGFISWAVLAPAH